MEPQKNPIGTFMYVVNEPYWLHKGYKEPLETENSDHKPGLDDARLALVDWTHLGDRKLLITNPG
jgi:hypothetical protein